MRAAGEAGVESIFVLVVVRCVCIVEEEVKWAGGLEAAKRFMLGELLADL